MNKAEKEVINEELLNEQKQLKMLERIYEKASEDCADKIRELSARTDMENIQSIVYQQKYQEALKMQIQDVLDALHQNSYKSISEYLSDCYETGYAGAMFDIYLQGVPIISPINTKQVLQALNVDSKLSQGLYNRLGEDVNYLKKSIRAEMSRGIANGSTWNEIANHIANGMNSPFNKAKNNAMRITRTEGHRIQTQSQMDALGKAKEKGADIVKQWDATLDSRTRVSHSIVDGEIRELDEPFSNGLMFPSDPSGEAEEVINCRCALLQRAKWGLDDEELQRLQDKADYFGLDKSDSFKDFKETYLNINEDDIMEFESDLPKDYDCDLAKKLGNDYYDEMHQCVVNCENEDLQKVWKKYESQIIVKDIDSKNGNYAMGSSIHITSINNRKGNSWKKPHATNFHESGHAIDSIVKKEGTGFGFHYSATYENGLFPKTIKEEIAEHVSSIDKHLKAEYKKHKDDIEWLKSNGYISSWSGEILKYSKDRAYKEFGNAVKSYTQGSGYAMGDISDIIEGATGGKIQLGYGHGKSYWTQRTYRGVADGLATETFAEMTSASMTNPESLDTIKHFLPKSYGVYNDMLKALLK